MSFQLSTTVRNGMLDSIETNVGTAPIMHIRSGAQPADCAAADSGTDLLDITLPSDWMAAAASGSKAKSGTWSGTVGTSGTAGHGRLKESTDTTTHAQWDCGQGSGTMSFDNSALVAGQTVTVNTFTLSAGNA